VKFTPTSIPDVVLIEPRIHEDSRGFFMETWQAKRYQENGIDAQFVQSNHSRSSRGTLRGLHYQVQQPQGKLVRVICGEVFDVAVDLRKSSPTFGQWTAVTLSDENKSLVWIPPGFAHGFLVLSEYADFEYRCTDYYAPQHERTICWDDPDIGVTWPSSGSQDLSLSAKDSAGTSLKDAETYA